MMKTPNITAISYIQGTFSLFHAPRVPQSVKQLAKRRIPHFVSQGHVIVYHAYINNKSIYAYTRRIYTMRKHMPRSVHAKSMMH